MNTVTLPHTLAAWGRAEFETALKAELAAQSENLPLQQALRYSSSVAGTPITVILQGAHEVQGGLELRVGIFYEGETGGCACAGDPTVGSPATEYCELLLMLDRASAQASITLQEP